MDIGGLGDDLTGLVGLLTVDTALRRREGRTLAPSIENSLLLSIGHTVGELRLVFRLHDLAVGTAASGGRIVVVPNLRRVHIEGEQITRLVADIIG